jgi:hypothetical protein
MEKYPWIVPGMLFIALIFTAGCMSQTAERVQTPAPTPTTMIPAPAMTPEIPEIPTAIPNASITTVPPVLPAISPAADPTDISKINFSLYSDSDFSVLYPSTWNVSTSYYIPYICENVLDPDRTDYHICYQNETASIGPFSYYDSEIYKKRYRVVTITSPDKKLTFGALIKDFIDGRAGMYRLNPDIEWAKSVFEINYPDLLSSTYISNYKYFSDGNTMTATYDVRLPVDSGYVPLAYTTKTYVTTHHLYEFGFFTDTESFSTYRNLNERMISSITITDL